MDRPVLRPAPELVRALRELVERGQRAITRSAKRSTPDSVSEWLTALPPSTLSGCLLMSYADLSSIAPWLHVLSAS